MADAGDETDLGGRWKGGGEDWRMRRRVGNVEGWWIPCMDVQVFNKPHERDLDILFTHYMFIYTALS